MSDNLKCQFDLFEILKAHSRTSSSGVLSVKWESSDLTLVLNEGKIIGVDSSGNRLSNIMLQRIANKLSLSDAELKSFKGTNIFSKSSQSSLSQIAGVLPHEIEHIQRSVESEELQKLSTFKEGDFEFNLAIPDGSRHFVINLATGQFILDLVQQGFRVAIPVEKEPEVEEVIVQVKKDQPQPKITEKKTGDTKSLERNWIEGEKGNIVTYFRMLNYHSLTSQGVRILYLASGLSLVIFCGWKIPTIFTSLVTALVELVKV